jgi:thiamine biosynthesis lipoprotein
VLDSETLTVYFADPEMSLDVGAIAKGYTAERIAEALSDAGFTSITLNLGGNVRVIGEKPNGEGWTTGVENPHVQGGEYIHKTTLTDGSAVTSGDYQRYYEVDGVRYHHIIDKDTLMPAAHFSSVTVYTRDSGLADALSTALFNMTYDEGAALVNTLDGVKVVWAFPNGEIRNSK